MQVAPSKVVERVLVPRLAVPTMSLPVLWWRRVTDHLAVAQADSAACRDFGSGEVICPTALQHSCTHGEQPRDALAASGRARVPRSTTPSCCRAAAPSRRRSSAHEWRARAGELSRRTEPKVPCERGGESRG